LSKDETPAPCINCKGAKKVKRLDGKGLIDCPVCQLDKREEDWSESAPGAAKTDQGKKCSLCGGLMHPSIPHDLCSKCIELQEADWDKCEGCAYKLAFEKKDAGPGPDNKTEITTKGSLTVAIKKEDDGYSVDPGKLADREVTREEMRKYDPEE